MPSPTIIIKNDPADVAVAGAELFVEIGRRSIGDRGRFSVALSGGSTPEALYRTLSGERFRDSIDWGNVVFFFGDERNVPADSPDSNYGMAKETLFDHVPLPDRNVFAWDTRLESPAEIAGDYERKLLHFFGGPPVFDLVLLGLGRDGHTASLFPDTEALREKESFAVANWVPNLNQHRLTLTFPVINRASNVVFVVTGDEKAEVVRDVIEGGSTDLPARMIRPLSGQLTWLLDAPAAAHLKKIETL